MTHVTSPTRPLNITVTLQDEPMRKMYHGAPVTFKRNLKLRQSMKDGRFEQMLVEPQNNLLKDLPGVKCHRALLETLPWLVLNSNVLSNFKIHRL